MIGWNDRDVLAAVLEDVERFIAGISTSLIFTKIYRWKEAAAMTPPGRSRNIARYRNAVDPSMGVFLAGDYMGFPCTEGAAESGKWAAEAIMRNLT